MGLDTTHDCFHGSYDAFSRFRNALCYVAGYGNMDALIETYQRRPFPEWAARGDNLLNDDPLIELIYHGDDEGELAAEVCLPLAERLEALADYLADGGGHGHLPNYRAAALQFAKGLRAAHEAGEAVEFH